MGGRGGAAAWAVWEGGGEGGEAAAAAASAGGTRAPALGVWLPVETVKRGSAVTPETQRGR